MNTDFQNIIGRDNFIWWIGVVEDIDDPLKLDRVRARIFGVHSSNLQELSTFDLPWSIPVKPANASRSSSTPNMGDFVFGFFLDGENFQMPAILGVFPSIPHADYAKFIESGLAFSPNAKYQSVPKNRFVKMATPTSTSAEKPGPGGDPLKPTKENDVQPTAPTNVPAMTIVKPGEPTTPALAYTYVGTIIEETNNNLYAACETIKKPLFKLGQQLIKDLIDFIAKRTALNAANKAISQSAFAQWIQKLIETIKRVIEMVQQIIKFIKMITEWIIGFINYVTSFINWVLNLPAELLKIAKKCIVELVGGLFNEASNQLTGNFGTELGGIASLTGTVNTLINTFGDAVKTVEGFTETLESLPDAFSEKTFVKP